jgi:transketolase
MKTYKDLGNFNNWLEIEKNQFSISVIKGLVMDATRQANSGHPGGPMSCADFA